MTSFSSMALYALTVQQPSATQHALPGDFIGNNKQQLLTASGSRLSILEISRRHKGFNEIHSQDVFGIIRHVDKFRMAGGTKDHIAITTDSGRMVTLEYIHEEQKFKTVHFETFGKSGVRRVIPGEYLAVDPKGRAIMVASIEKNKLVYILTRSGQTDISISSPLEAHKPQTLVFYLLGLDVGYDNPMFAALELDFSQSDQDPSGEAFHMVEKELVYYELDLGLNHVVRKWSETVDRSSNILFRVPGGPEMPSGVLCCGEDNISYRCISNHPESVQRLAIPRREGATEDPNRKRMIVAGTLYTLKGGDFFYLLQTDDGDLFKVTFDAPGGRVASIKIKYFDTIPVATSICLLKAGFVYCACESGDRIIYELESLGDETDDPIYESSQFPADPSEPYDTPFFRPRPLRNLTAVDEIPSMSPIMDMEVANITMEDAPQIYTVCGSGARSTFRTTRNAMDVLDLIESQLPQQATTVWTTKLTINDEFDALIVLSLISHTLILKIGEDVDEATNLGFITDCTTLGVQQFGEDCVIQIHPKGIRHIREIQFPEDNSAAVHGELTDWHVPEHRTIVACASNNRQVAIALSDARIFYFECDSDGSLAKADEEIILDHPVNCLAIPDVPEGSVRAYFMAVGSQDLTIHVYNLSPDINGKILQSASVQSVSAQPSDMSICYMRDKTSRGLSQYLHVGLRSGIYISSVLDEHTGDTSSVRRRYLGTAPVRFARVTASGDAAIVAITSRPWLSYTDPRTGTLATTPLNYSPFDSAWSFASAQFKGVICIRGDGLRIFALESVADKTSHESIPLKYTPRKMIGYHDEQLYYVIESDNNTMDSRTQALLKSQANGKTDRDGDTAMNGDAAEEDHADSELPPVEFGHPRAVGRWASCIQVVDPVSEKTVIHTVELQKNQCAISVALVAFESKELKNFLAVGVATDLVHSPYSYKSGSVHIYRVTQHGRSLEFLHETEFPEPPLALLGFKGKLLVGIGRDLEWHDCGLKSLLRKALRQNCTQTRINGLKTQGNRIVVSDQQQSVTYVVHKELVHPNKLIPFADDTIARFTTCAAMVDYDTVVGGDKFGNIWMLRCPQKVSEESDDSTDGMLLEQTADKNGFLHGAPNRLDAISHFFCNDIPMSIQKTSLINGGDRVVFWAGLQGTLGALVPFQSRRSFKMFQQLELVLRSEEKPVSGRDHLAYRSYYIPVKGVIDGDLIESFLLLSRDKKESVIAQMDGNYDVAEVEEQIWNMRGLYAF